VKPWDTSEWHLITGAPDMSAEERKDERSRWQEPGPAKGCDYLLLDLALLLVPRATIFLTHPTVMLDSHSGAPQITFEWYLPH
jgi:hypothetical protein